MFSESAASSIGKGCTLVLLAQISNRKQISLKAHSQNQQVQNSDINFNSDFASCAFSVIANHCLIITVHQSNALFHSIIALPSSLWDCTSLHPFRKLESTKLLRFLTSPYFNYLPCIISDDKCLHQKPSCLSVNGKYRHYSNNVLS